MSLPPPAQAPPQDQQAATQANGSHTGSGPAGDGGTDDNPADGRQTDGRQTGSGRVNSGRVNSGLGGVERPVDLGVPLDAPVPAGLRVMLDPGTQRLAGDVLFGGSPARVLRLSPAGAAALTELSAGAVTSAAAGVLARVLTDAGLAHPALGRPAGPAGADEVAGAGAPGGVARDSGVAGTGGTVRAGGTGGTGGGTGLDVTVVVPVRDRAVLLDRCLGATGRGLPVLVVDDGSAEPAAVAAVCARHGAWLARREVNGGPAAARNTALGLIGTEYVAFLDSDCVPQPDWIARLAGHFADPLVAAVAPRIVAAPQPGRHGGPAAGSSVLDLGDRAARVAPMTRVSYVPTAALVARRAALGRGFDARLRYGEDVDLVWRLVKAGWRVRYEPAVQVGHEEPPPGAALLHRRFRYGSSAAPLSRRHPGALTPLVLQPWPAATVAALLARRPAVAAATFTASVAVLARRLAVSDLPARGLAGPMASGVVQTWLGAGRWCGQFAAPALLAVAARPGGRAARTRWGRRLAAVSLLAGPPVADWLRRRDGGLVRYTARALAGQAAYGAGVYAGCVRERTLAPLLPAVTARPFEGLSRPGGKRAGPQ